MGGPDGGTEKVMADKHSTGYIDKRSYKNRAELQTRSAKKLMPLDPRVLFSGYLASAAIVVLCIIEARGLFAQGDTQTGGFYIILAVLGALASGFITWRQAAAKKQMLSKKAVKTAAIKAQKKK